MQIVELIFPLILVIGLGYLCARTRWLDKPGIQALSKVTFNIAIPAFLFQKMATAQVPEHISPWFFAAFYLPVLLCFALAWLINYLYHARYRRSSAGSAAFALGSSYSNTVIIGLPILLPLHGQQAVVLTFLIVTFHSALLFTVTNLLAAGQQQFQWRKFIGNTLNNPLIISILSGAVVNMAGISLPDLALTSLTLLAKPALTLALFVLGASLTFYSIRAEKAFILLACTIKLLLLPALVLLCSHYLWQLDTLATQVLVILSACPTGVNAYLIAENIKAHQQTVASTVVLSTMLAMLSIPLWLYILQQL